MDLTEYRNSGKEQERVADLMALVPADLGTALDIGARDGFLARRLAESVGRVTALDLEKPEIDDERIDCVAGDITNLEFSDGTFDLVFCAEVLEHISPDALQQACSELMRVSSRYILIGVPYKQDIRRGRTTCAACGGKNPPWGHVNRFDEKRLTALFSPCSVQGTSYVGQGEAGTNWLASVLMDAAGNPYGTYSQEEPCIHCGATLVPPGDRNLLAKVFSKFGYYAQHIQLPWQRNHANWIHMLFAR